MTTETNFVQDHKAKLQYKTFSRGISYSDVSPEVAGQYGITPGNGVRLNALVRFDDDRKNGHCTLSVTGSILSGRKEIAGGQISDIIGEVFPELRPAMKFHLVSTDGPLHYLANVTYLAGDRDHNGRAKGKARNLDSARNAAIWPDATDEELSVSKEELTAKLKERLPDLMAEFRQVVESLGFDYDFPSYQRNGVEA